MKYAPIVLKLDRGNMCRLAARETIGMVPKKLKATSRKMKHMKRDEETA